MRQGAYLIDLHPVVLHLTNSSMVNVCTFEEVKLDPVAGDSDPVGESEAILGPPDAPFLEEQELLRQRCCTIAQAKLREWATWGCGLCGFVGLCPPFSTTHAGQSYTRISKQQVVTSSPSKGESRCCVGGLGVVRVV